MDACAHCGAPLTPRLEPELGALPPALIRILDVVRDAGDLDTEDVAMLCHMDPPEALDGLEALADGLGLLGRDGDGWTARALAAPRPELVSRMWAARGAIRVDVGAPPRPLPWPPLALGLPRVARSVLGRLRTGGVLGAGDLRGVPFSREGIRRGLLRLVEDGWASSDVVELRHGGAIHVWRLVDVRPVEL